MVLLRRLALLGSMLICVSVAFTAAAIATDAHIAAGSVSDAHIAAATLSIQGKGTGGGGGLLPAGSYHNTTVFANYSFAAKGPQLSVNVTDTTNIADPRVGPATSQHEVDVNFHACGPTPGTCGGGCFIPDGAHDWTFSANLSRASLKTRVTDSTLPCQGMPVTGLTRPFTVNVTWTAVGQSSETSNLGNYACSGYESQTLTTTNGGTATNATATTSLFPGTFPVTGANLSSFEQRIHAQGTPLDSCTPLGGKGAGPGPLAAGKYHFVSQSANLTIVPADPSHAPITVFVTTFTNTSSPKGGATTTQHETDLNIGEFGPTQFIGGCFIIPASAFTSAGNLESAAVHASIDATTPLCPQSINSGLPPSFTVNATWSGTGPIASLRINSSSECANFHVTMSGSETTINATATGGLTGIADPFSTTQASIGTGDSNFRVTGQQTCF
jgi:hypothetical protein